MDCPSCGLTNPPTAQICDCGHNFEIQARGKPILSTPAWGDMITIPTGREFVLASLAQRWLGQVIDAVIAVALAVVLILTGHYLGLGDSVLPSIALAFYVAYLLFSDGFKGGQSLGKKIVNTAVVGSYDGKPCSYGQSLVRNLLQILNFIDWIFIFGKNANDWATKRLEPLLFEHSQLPKECLNYSFEGFRGDLGVLGVFMAFFAAAAFLPYAGMSAGR